MTDASQAVLDALRDAEHVITRAASSAEELAWAFNKLAYATRRAGMRKNVWRPATPPRLAKMARRA